MINPKSINLKSIPWLPLETFEYYDDDLRLNRNHLREIGERIPKGIQIAASGYKLSVKEFISQVDKREIKVSDFIPKFIAEYRRIYGEKSLKVSTVLA